MLKFMLNYAICNSEANRTIVKLIAKQLKCMKKRSQYIERRVHTIPLPPKYKLEKKFRAQNIITSKYRRRVLNSEHNERMPFLQKAKYYLHIFKFYSNNLL